MLQTAVIPTLGYYLYLYLIFNTLTIHGAEDHLRLNADVKYNYRSYIWKYIYIIWLNLTKDILS